MHVVSLIASPGRLDRALVAGLQGALGGGGAVWLPPDEAAEFTVERMPAEIGRIRGEIAGMGVDVNCFPLAIRRKRLLIADMDSTMIGQECIDELADEAGVGARVAEITARAMNGELDFEAALTERVGLLAGLPVAVIDKVVETRITLAPGGATLVATMKSNGARTALVSGGFTQFTSRIGARLGFDETRANTLIEKDGRLTGAVAHPILGRAAKAEALRALSPDPADALAVGDGANDLGMIALAGMGVALHAKPVVAAAAPLRIDHNDLTSLLFLQGYARDEFQTR